MNSTSKRSSISTTRKQVENTSHQLDPLHSKTKSPSTPTKLPLSSSTVPSTAFNRKIQVKKYCIKNSLRRSVLKDPECSQQARDTHSWNSSKWWINNLTSRWAISTSETRINRWWNRERCRHKVDVMYEGGDKLWIDRKTASESTSNSFKIKARCPIILKMKLANLELSRPTPIQIWPQTSEPP